MTYEEIVDYLFNLPRFTLGGHMENVKLLLQLFGNPQETFKYIHVAGTNGKGSVCAYLECGLRNIEKRVGFFSSPHLIRVNERIRVDGMDISDTDFVRLFYLVKDMAASHKSCVEPTFFEYIYVMAMLYFKEQHVEYAVVETGLGGRLDFTNVIWHPALTVLTAISFDHMNVLGDTIEQIADEKAIYATFYYAGNVRPATPVSLFVTITTNSGVERKVINTTITNDGTPVGGSVLGTASQGTDKEYDDFLIWSGSNADYNSIKKVEAIVYSAGSGDSFGGVKVGSGTGVVWNRPVQN